MNRPDLPIRIASCPISSDRVTVYDLATGESEEGRAIWRPDLGATVVVFVERVEADTWPVEEIGQEAMRLGVRWGRPGLGPPEKTL